MQHITSNPISSTYISLGQNMVSMAHFSSISQSCPTIWNPIDCSTSGFSVHHRLLELSQIHVDQVGDVIQQSHPLLSPYPPGLNLTQHQGLFWWISSSHQVAKVLELQLPMNIQDWFPLGLTDWIQGTLKSLLQHHSSKAWILWHSTFLLVQLSHPCMTVGKTIALTRQTFVGKIMSLLFNMLSRLVIAFFPRSKDLLISWLQSPSAVILDPRK